MTDTDTAAAKERLRIVNERLRTLRETEGEDAMVEAFLKDSSPDISPERAREIDEKATGMLERLAQREVAFREQERRREQVLREEEERKEVLFNDPEALWRSRPMSDKQREFLEMKGLWKCTCKKPTRGEASDMIDKHVAERTKRRRKKNESGSH